MKEYNPESLKKTRYCMPATVNMTKRGTFTLNEEACTLLNLKVGDGLSVFIKDNAIYLGKSTKGFRLLKYNACNTTRLYLQFHSAKLRDVLAKATEMFGVNILFKIKPERIPHLDGAVDVFEVRAQR